MITSTLPKPWAGYDHGGRLEWRGACHEVDERIPISIDPDDHVRFSENPSGQSGKKST